MELKYDFLDGDRRFNVRVFRDPEGPGKRKSGRAFVSNRCDSLNVSDVLDGFRVALGLSTVFTTRGEYPALDKAFDAFNTLVMREKEDDLKTALDYIATRDDAIDLDFKSKSGIQPKFSRYAGCSCGCSPGFMLQGTEPDLMVYVSVDRGEPAAVGEVQTVCENKPVWKDTPPHDAATATGMYDHDDVN